MKDNKYRCSCCDKIKSEDNSVLIEWNKKILMLTFARLATKKSKSLIINILKIF
jgi:hypothetical protein